MGFHALPLPLAQLSLAAVLKCGQSFRWSTLPLLVSDAKQSAPTHEYRLCLQDRVVCLRQDDHTLWYRAAFAQAPKSAEEQALRDTETLAWIRDYCQLDVDLQALYDDWSRRDPVFARLRDRFSGIRMLRQDPWENLVRLPCLAPLPAARSLASHIASYARQITTSAASRPW
jgi:N-glycosylase/DNA lyase